MPNERSVMNKTSRAAKTDYDDVDDVIDLAERLRMADADRLSAQEMTEVGEDLGIPQKYVDQARRQLSEQRAVEAREKRGRAANERKIRRFGAIISIVLIAIGCIWSAVASSSLGDAEAALRAQSRQVQSARQRQSSVHTLLADRPASPDKDAELIGAENRVRVELKRCNEALSAYQRAANSFPVSLWADATQFDQACASEK